MNPRNDAWLRIKTVIHKTLLTHLYFGEMVMKMFVDLRNTLPTNQEGEKSITRSEGSIIGVTFHQAFCWASLEELAQYHIGINHHSEIGFERTPYHYGIRTNGEICWLNDHVLGSRIDANTIMVVFEGCFRYGNNSVFYGVDCGEPTSQQLESAKKLWEFLKTQYNFNNSQLYGHYHFGNPDCPGNTLRQFIEQIRNGA